MQRFSAYLEKRLGLDGFSSRENAPVVTMAYGFALLAIALRLIFWAYTNRYWEDALITCLNSENWVRGLGLTHVQPDGQPIHSFTSPISVLIPLIGDIMHIGFGVELLKLVSALGAALTIFYAAAIAIHPSLKFPLPLTAMLLGYLTFEHHQILFGMSGMESQVITLILFMSVYYLVSWKLTPLAISLALCMYARPDFGFWTVIVGVYILFKEPRRFPFVAGTALALYAPWVIFTTLYYGSPMPNSMRAKQYAFEMIWQREDFGLGVFFKHGVQVYVENLGNFLSPAFGGHGDNGNTFWFESGANPIALGVTALAVLGLIASIRARQWVFVPIPAWGLVYTAYYLYLAPHVFAWYKVPYSAMIVAASIRGLQAVASLAPESRRKYIYAPIAIAYVAMFAVVLPKTFYTEWQIQTHIENEVRKPMGLFLGSVVQPDESVGCEPAGYTSYYSRRIIHDWPGLTSSTVVRLARANPKARSYEGMLETLRPEYLCIRDFVFLLHFDAEWIRRDYHPIALFHLDPEIYPTIAWIERNVDTSYRVYKKNAPDDALPYMDVLWPRLPPAVLENQ